MRNKPLIILLCLLFSVGVAFAEINGYIKTDWTGGGADDLDGIAVAGLTTGDVAIVMGIIDGIAVDSSYTYDSASSATESGITNIKPDDGTGRWVQSRPAFFFGTVEPSVTVGVIWFDTSE